MPAIVIIQETLSDMQAQRMDTQAPATARSSIAPSAKEHPSVRMLSAAAFVLLVVALCARCLLSESRTIWVGQLIAPLEARSGASLMFRHVLHLLAAGGIALGTLWIVLSQRRWRLGGLEVGAMVLAGAALLSVPVASDKRLALNMAIDAILPMMAAAVLYQLLADRLAWRRVLLAVIVAVTVANCWKATAQYRWEYRQRWEAGRQNRAKLSPQDDPGADDPRMASAEAYAKWLRPMGFIQGANVFSSLLLLGLTGSLAALAGSGWWRARRQPSESGEEQKPDADMAGAPSGRPDAAGQRSLEAGGRGGANTVRALAAGAIITALALLVMWHLVVLSWVHTGGSTVGMAAALLAGIVAIRLRNHPRRLAILLASGLVLLQITLIVLAMSSPDLRRALLNCNLAGGKIRTFGHRLFIYESAIRLFAAHPFTGVGPSQFAYRYMAVRPAYVNTIFADAHNWLLTTAAEWGILGVFGVVIAVAGCGWTILRALARPSDKARQSAGAVLLPAMLIVLGCWLVVAWDLPRSRWAGVLPWPIAISLVVAALVSLCSLRGRAGSVILLAGLVGFFVHCTAEITPTVPAIMWPFWAMVALAMAWSGREPAPSTADGPIRRRMAWVGPVLAGATAVTVVALTVQPMRAVGLMHQAQRAVAALDPDPVAKLLRAAAAADPLDPLPLRAAAMLHSQLGRVNTPRALEHLRDAAALSQAAVQRSLFDYECWQSLATANMTLGCATEDFTLVDEAIRDMQKVLELNPRWSKGWLELARMAAVTGGTGDRPALLRTAIQATDTALSLDDSRPYEAPSLLTPQERAELLAMRGDLFGRLKAAAE